MNLPLKGFDTSRKANIRRKGRSRNKNLQGSKKIQCVYKGCSGREDGGKMGVRACVLTVQ